MIKFTFIFIILYWLMVRPKGEKAVNTYIFICAALFFIMIGFRNETIYGDTAGYVFRYKQLAEISFSRMIDGVNRDRLYWIVGWGIAQIVGDNYTIWLALQAFAIIIPVTLLIKRYSSEPMYSWIVLFFIGFTLFFMAGLRQTVAMSFTLLGFLVLLDDKRNQRNKLWWFVVLVVLASFFHSSAWICLIALLFLHRRLNGVTILLYILSLTVILLYGRTLMFSFTSFVGQYDSRYIIYGEKLYGSTMTYFFQQLILVIPSIYLLRNRLKEPLVALFCHFGILGLLIISLSPIVAEMFRLSFYFSWANLIIFPLAIQEMRKRANILPMLYMLFFIVYLIFINKSAWGTYYFWFEDTTQLMKNFYLEEMYF